METHAELSNCRKYRYALWRTWDKSKEKVMFIGLNPATADEVEDDRTIRRCVNYAKQWGYGGIIMANLFAFRTQSPAEMMASTDPVGPENDRWLRDLASQAPLIVAMWGNLGKYRNRAFEVAKMFPELKCLRITGAGQPHHTRGLPNGLHPLPYSC